MLNIQYFASIREALGLSSEQLLMPDNVSNVASLARYLAQRGQVWQQLDDSSQVLIAVNQQVADRSTLLHGDEEVAFFPPMTGG